MTYTKETEYKGFPVFSVCYMRDGEEKTLVSFGLKKAEGILEHIDELRAWVETNGKEAKNVER